MRRIIRLPAETLEAILAGMLQSQPTPKLTLGNEQIRAMESLQLIVTETNAGLELESCESFGEVRPEIVPGPPSDQFPVFSEH